MKVTLLAVAGTAFTPFVWLVLSFATHTKLVELAYAGLIPVSVAVPDARVIVPNTICALDVAVAEQVEVVPQFCTLG